MEELIRILKQSENLVFFGGAGVSTESGIPDFRSAKGIYSTKGEIAPEEIVSHTFFMNNPEEFYRFYKEKMMHLEAQPNAAHQALVKLEQEGKLKAIITQNIDGLHQRAGSKVVYELHGSIHRNYCMKCGKSYRADFVKEALGVPRCSCGGIIKPDVVLYEEGLDNKVIEKSIQAIEKADTLIVGGTSLIVYPAASFVDYFRGKHLIVINKGETGKKLAADLVIDRPIGEVFQEVMKQWDDK
ncbi:MAG TPA: NAD-dependent protein deacylase [Candidatus Dorea intestinavium]|nr:NAD-dependent protein deacylase [Candidatus Dorea intestinavium]